MEDMVSHDNSKATVEGCIWLLMHFRDALLLKFNFWVACQPSTSGGLCIIKKTKYWENLGYFLLPALEQADLSVQH